jgi:hypothetical protein
MAEPVKQERQANKTEGNLDPAKQGKERAASETATEVEGRGVLIFVTCPFCGTHRIVSFDYEGEWYTCGHCAGTYQLAS